MTVKRFEDLIAWQKARGLTKQIYEITRRGEFSKDFGLRDQIQRASVSIMSNIAEGFERNSPAEFARFLAIARGSCAELRSQLIVAFDIGYLSQSEFDASMALAVEVARLLAALRKSVEPYKP